MVKKSNINEILRFAGWFILIMTVIATFFVFTYDLYNPFINGMIVLISGSVASLLLFAISEILMTLRKIEFNTRKELSKPEVKETAIVEPVAVEKEEEVKEEETTKTE